MELTVRVYRPVRVSGRVTFPDGSPAPGIVVEATKAVGPLADRSRLGPGQDRRRRDLCDGPAAGAVVH